MALPGISRAQMREVDRLMSEEHGIPLEVMLEHAGVNLAGLALLHIDEGIDKENGDKGSGRPSFFVICGTGGNGAGGLVATRRLLAWGYDVHVLLPKGKAGLGEVASTQLARVENIGGAHISEGVNLLIDTALTDQTIVLDAYLGYGYQQRHDEVSEWVFSYLAQKKNVITLDAPSGMDVNTGESQSRTRPLATLALAFVKQGHLQAAPEHLGNLYIGDIGVPWNIYEDKLGIFWEEPFKAEYLRELASAFSEDPLQLVALYPKQEDLAAYWVLDDDYNGNYS